MGLTTCLQTSAQAKETSNDTLPALGLEDLEAPPVTLRPDALKRVSVQ